MEESAEQSVIQNSEDTVSAGSLDPGLRVARTLSCVRTAKQLVDFYKTEKLLHHSQQSLSAAQWKLFSKLFKQQMHHMKTLPQSKWKKQIKKIKSTIKDYFINT